jgi:sporulation protein YabP
VLEERSSLSISGVEEVDSFDENTITLSTCQGALIIRGENLHIEKLSLDGGDLRLEGSIDSLTYEENKSKGGFLSRLLG